MLKDEIFALAMLSIAPLLANESYQSMSCASQDGCSPVECKPCCVPEPKNCIDCECYTPAYYDLQCDWGIYISGDFLYWYARETNLSYANQIQILQELKPIGDSKKFFGPTKVYNFDTSWDPGFRVGIGWNMSCDGWDTSLNWTCYENKRSDSTSVPPYADFEGQTNVPKESPYLASPWSGKYTALFQTSGIGNKISAKWHLRFNQIDWELGRKYWLSQCFSLRPYTGLRGAWAKTTMSSLTSSPTQLLGSFQTKNRLSNDNWGVGILGGLQPNWHFCSNFILYSNFEGALLWGESKAKNKQTINIWSTSYNSGEIQQNFYTMYAALDLAIGLRWEENWCCDRYKTALDLGWEHHIWFDYNHRNHPGELNGFTNLGLIYFAASEETGNLMLGGFVLRLRLDF